MTLDEVVKGAVLGLLGLLGTAVTALMGLVFKNWSGVAEGKIKIKALESDVEDLKDSQLTKEDVREVVDAALERRDKQNALRRIDWEKRLSLQIKQAVIEGIRDCPHSKNSNHGDG